MPEEKLREEDHPEQVHGAPPIMERVTALLGQGEVEKAKKAASAFLASIPKEARGTRLIIYALLLQEQRFTLKEGGQEKFLGEASACLREETENVEGHLAAAWLLTAFGGELSPEERDRALAAAEPFHKQRAKKQQKTMAMTIVAAHAADTEVVTDALRGIPRREGWAGHGDCLPARSALFYKGGPRGGKMPPPGGH